MGPTQLPFGDGPEPESRIAGRDAASLAALYDQHIDAIYSLAIRIVGESSEAEAVVQEVFTLVWSDAVRCPVDGATATHLLLGLTRERAIDRVRVTRRSGDADTDTPADGVATVCLPQPAFGLSDDGPDSVATERMRERLAGLPLLTRLSLELAYFDGLTLAQVARQLEQPEETVHERIRAGLSELRAAVEESDR